MKKCLLLFLFSAFVCFSAFSSSTDVYDKEQVVEAFFLQHLATEVDAKFDELELQMMVYDTSGVLLETLEAYPVLEENSQDLMAYVFYSDKMFLAVSHYRSLKAIKAFSTEAGIRFLNGEKPHSIGLIEGIYQSAYNTDEIELRAASLPSEGRGNLTMYGPWLSSVFGQVNCRDEQGNIVNVSNYYTPNNYAPGCVAITLVNVLHYFKWPPIGVGTSSYSDTYGSSTGDYSANYGGRYYDWENILNRYDNKATSLVERQALGKLAYDAAVALRTDFEYDGSSSNISKIPSVVKAFFRFSYANYLTTSSSEFWTQLDRNMEKGIPVPLAIESSTITVDHAIVCDGLYYDESAPDDVMYHLNMGWWGDDNGWYDIQNSFNAGSYTKITAGVFNFTPIPYMESPSFVAPDSIFVSWQFPEAENHKLEGFELEAHTGDEDWQVIAYCDSGVKSYTFKSDSKSDYYFRVKALTQDYTSAYSDVERFYEYPASLSQTAMNDALELFPTLVEEALQITTESLDLSKAAIRVYDMAGMAQSFDLTHHSRFNLELSTSTFKSGAYILSVETEDGILNKRFLKK